MEKRDGKRIYCRQREKAIWRDGYMKMKREKDTVGEIEIQRFEILSRERDRWRLMIFV